MLLRELRTYEEGQDLWLSPWGRPTANLLGKQRRILQLRLYRKELFWVLPQQRLSTRQHSRGLWGRRRDLLRVPPRS